MGRRYDIDDLGPGPLGNIHQSTAFGSISDEVKVQDKARLWKFCS